MNTRILTSREYEVFSLLILNNTTKDIAKELSKTDISYVMDIHPAREKQDDYPEVTSNLIIDKLGNCYHITMDGALALVKYDNCVFVCMSPNDISKLENDLIEGLKR